MASFPLDLTLCGQVELWLLNWIGKGLCVVDECTCIFKDDVYTWAWWLIGRFVAFRPKGRGFESRSSRQDRDLGQVLHSQLPVALRRETPTQYPCCVGSASE